MSNIEDHIEEKLEKHRPPSLALPFSIRQFKETVAKEHAQPKKNKPSTVQKKITFEGSNMKQTLPTASQIDSDWKKSKVNNGWKGKKNNQQTATYMRMDSLVSNASSIDGFIDSPQIKPSSKNRILPVNITAQGDMLEKTAQFALTVPKKSYMSHMKGNSIIEEVSECFQSVHEQSKRETEQSLQNQKKDQNRGSQGSEKARSFRSIENEVIKKQQNLPFESFNSKDKTNKGFAKKSRCASRQILNSSNGKIHSSVSSLKQGAKNVKKNSQISQKRRPRKGDINTLKQSITAEKNNFLDANGIQELPINSNTKSNHSSVHSTDQKKKPTKEISDGLNTPPFLNSFVENTPSKTSEAQTKTIPFNSLKKKSRSREEDNEKEKQISPKKTNSQSKLPFDLLFGFRQEPSNKSIESPNKKNSSKSPTVKKNHKKILNAFASNDDRKMEQLKNEMKNQKNLKLKDYLRLASLSSSSKTDNRERRRSKLKHNKSVNEGLNLKKKFETSERSFNNSPPSKSPRSSMMHKNVINRQKSLSLIKTAINSKLNRTLKIARQLVELLGDQEFVGDQYGDLVFACNIHRVFDENMFKPTRALRFLFQEFDQKRKFNNNSEEFVKDIVETVLVNCMSPNKRKKKANNELDLVSKVLGMFSGGSSPATSPVRQNQRATPR